MPSLTAANLISRHVEKLRARPDKEKLEQVLAITGLTVAGEHVMRAGRVVTGEDCQAYKHAVRDVYGAATYSFTKVNFVLGGCTCGDCKN